ncbi:MAG: dockerin type I repeat-containing protein, partial [Lachnospiraceae bacterium]|nr:dockerin type I repeat-containing protein [Lachnospiraceae bacterium]
VCSVTHNLENAQAEKHYYKGVSAGKTFEETVTGEDISVTVTMGGKDITAEVYKDGKISISSVTGDIVVTAKGKFNCDGHLQKLPEKLCAGTNLWTALEPENIYYTATGWGNLAAGTSWSITFPVTEGERIYATAFGAYPGNGSTANGTRITWFDENGVLESIARDVVYKEFAANGYITVPQGATAVNVPHSSNNSEFEVYLLDREHDYSSAITEPTCTEQGYTTYTCSICGESYNGNYVSATGHSLGEWYLHKAPTTSEAGEERRDCANCDYYESPEVPAYKVGDINRDGKVNTIDANYARRYAAELLTLDAGQKLAGDVNLDGEINVIDSAIIRRYVVKRITSLPYTG